MEKRSGAGDAADAAEADTMRVLLLPLPSPPLLRPPLFLRDRSGLPGFSTCGSVYLTAPVLGIGGLTKTWCALSLVPVGTALLLEKESRRKEIAAYCSARALESFLVCAVAWGWIPKRMQVKRFDVLLFCLGVGLITHCYSDNEGNYRESFRSKYLNVIGGSNRATLSLTRKP